MDSESAAAIALACSQPVILHVKAMMGNTATEKLKDGRKFVDPIMYTNGFHWEAGLLGKSSGGYSDSGQYIKGNRRLELHFRYSF